MSKLRKELKTGLIMTMLKKRRIFPRAHKMEDWDDLIHTVYLECLEREKYYNEEYSLSTFVSLQISSVFGRSLREPKHFAEMESKSVGDSSLLFHACGGLQEERVYLDELLCRIQPHHIAKLMGYTFLEIAEMTGRTEASLRNKHNEEMRCLLDSI